MALINGLEGRRSVQSKLVLFTALFTILSAFSTGATVKSGDFNLDTSKFNFSENAKIAVWSEERPKTTENVSPNQPLNPGEELSLGVTVDADTDSVPQFGEELELYSTQDGTDYQKITDYGFLNRHLKLENGELSFVVPSVEIEGSKGLNTEDAIQVEGRVYGEDLRQASDKIDVSDYLNGKTGGINLRQVREGEDKSYTVKVDKASPQVKNIAKINSTAVRIQIEDPGAAKIDNKSLLSDGKLEDDVFSYEPIASALGTDAPGHEFRYLKDESSADEAVYLLLLYEKFKESKALEIFLDSSIKDTQGNEITSLGLESRVNDMNDQPPQVVTELVGDQQLTLGSTFTVNMYARSVDDVESVSIDASEVSENGVKGKSQGLQIQKDCENDDWDSECVKFEKDFTVTRGSDGSNTIQVSASNENGKTNKEGEVDLSIVPQDAQEIRVYDKDHDGDIDTAEVEFESEIKKSSVNPDDPEGWKLIGPEGEKEATSAELTGGNSKVVKLTFESDVDTTDANKVDVVYDSPQNDFLKTSNGARVPSINKGTIVETDEAAPVPVDYRLQEHYDKAVLKFSEKIKSAQYEGDDDNFEGGVEAIEDSNMAIVNIDVGVGSPNGGPEEFSAEDGTGSGSVTKAISRSRAGEDSRFVVLNKGWNIAALPVPGDVEGTETTDKSLSEGEELSSLSCVKQTYRRVGSWSTGVSDLSHRYGTYVESNRPCILEFSTKDLVGGLLIIDSSEVGEGWNLLSPYTGSDGFDWIGNLDVEDEDISAPEDAIEEDVSPSDGEGDLNRYDSYWVENEN